MSSELGSNYRCKQLFRLMENIKSRTRTRLANENFERCIRFETADMKPDILKQNQYQISQKGLILLDKVK
jgi:hypothetical protein